MRLKPERGLGHFGRFSAFYYFELNDKLHNFIKKTFGKIHGGLGGGRWKLDKVF